MTKLPFDTDRLHLLSACAVDMVTDLLSLYTTGRDRNVCNVTATSTKSWIEQLPASRWAAHSCTLWESVQARTCFGTCAVALIAPENANNWVWCQILRNSCKTEGKENQPLYAHHTVSANMNLQGDKSLSPCNEYLHQPGYKKTTRRLELTEPWPLKVRPIIFTSACVTL